MTETLVKARYMHPIKTAAEWIASDPVLLYGEVGYESDTGKSKVGDGGSKWSELSYTDKDNVPADHTHNSIKVRDIRNESSSPALLGQNNLSFFFSNKNMPSSTWYSGINAAGWTVDGSVPYQVWQLASGSNVSANNKLYFRTGLGESWQPWQRFYTTNDKPVQIYHASTDTEGYTTTSTNVEALALTVPKADLPANYEALIWAYINGRAQVAAQEKATGAGTLKVLVGTAEKTNQIHLFNATHQTSSANQNNMGTTTGMGYSYHLTGGTSASDLKMTLNYYLSDTTNGGQMQFKSGGIMAMIIPTA